MVISEPDPNLESKRRSARFLYLSIYIITTCLATVTLSIMGHLPFDPPTAFVAGIIAGFALGIFQMTYIRFIARTSWRIKGRPLD